VIETQPKKQQVTKKNTSNKAFHHHLAKEFHRIRNEVETLNDEKAILSVMSIIFWWVTEKNRGMLNSIKMSDYLKQEPYLDHWFYKLATEYKRKKEQNPKKNVPPKRTTRKFGIFDIPKKK
jgi:hypothetical protein